MNEEGQINSVPGVSTIVNAGEPMARLVPVVRLKKLGLLRGRIDVPANINAPLSPDELADFEGRCDCYSR